MTCATQSATGLGVAYLCSADSDAAPPHRRPTQLHTENNDTIPAAALAPTPVAAAIASMLFTSAIAAPDDAMMENHKSQNSGHVAHSARVKLDFSRPARGGCSWVNGGSAGIELLPSSSYPSSSFRRCRNAPSLPMICALFSAHSSSSPSTRPSELCELRSSSSSSELDSRLLNRSRRLPLCPRISGSPRPSSSSSSHAPLSADESNVTDLPCADPPRRFHPIWFLDDGAFRSALRGFTIPKPSLPSMASAMTGDVNAPSTATVRSTFTRCARGPNASLSAADVAAHPTRNTVHPVTFPNAALSAFELTRPPPPPSPPSCGLTSRMNGEASVATTPPMSAIMSTKVCARACASVTTALSAGLGVGFVFCTQNTTSN